MSIPLVYALTVNWNRAPDTIECLESLFLQDVPNLRYLIVDNASADDSPRIISEKFPQLEQVIIPKNIGFAGGYNTGIQRALEAGADYVFILNNDATIAPGALSQLLKHAAPDVGLIAPLIYYAYEPTRIWSSGGSTSRWNLEMHDEWAGQIDPGDLPEVLERNFITSCALLFTRKTLETVGMFDRDFFLYYEDSDLSRRVRKAGLRILVITQAKAWHKVSLTSGGKNTPYERYWMARSSVLFFSRHARGMQVPIVFFWRTGSALRTTLRLARLGKMEALQAYWRGLKEGLLLNFRSDRK